MWRRCCYRPQHLLGPSIFTFGCVDLALALCSQCGPSPCLVLTCSQSQPSLRAAGFAHMQINHKAPVCRAYVFVLLMEALPAGVEDDLRFEADLVLRRHLWGLVGLLGLCGSLGKSLLGTWALLSSLHRLGPYEVFRHIKKKKEQKEKRVGHVCCCSSFLTQPIAQAHDALMCSCHAAVQCPDRHIHCTLTRRAA